MARSVNPARIAREWLASRPPVSATPGTGGELAIFAQTFANNIEIDDAPLKEELTKLYTDAYVAGVKDAVTSLEHDGGQIPEDPGTRFVIGLDWGTWTPGHPPAADKLLGTGLDDMLQRADITIKGIDDTTRNEIAKILEQGIRNGDSATTITDAIDKIRKNRYRSRLIAITESNRAMTQASIDSYANAGVEMFDLITARDPCPICASIAASNPHPLTSGDQPPLHPACRCSAAPVI